MNFQGKATLDASPEEVWAVLLDVDQFAACMPGVEDVTQIDGHTFDGTIGANVGPMSGKFAFRARIVESDPPREMSARVDGTDSVTKSTMTADLGITLSPAGERTELSYRATVEIKGRLALLGDMVFRATAVVVLEEFTKRLQVRVLAGGVRPGGSGDGS